MSAPPDAFLVLAPAATLAALAALWAAAAQRTTSRRATVFTLGWGALVLLPLVWLTFFSDGPLAPGRVYDFGGAIPFSVSLGAAAFWVARRGSPRGMPVTGRPAAIALCLAVPVWLVWLTGMELWQGPLIGPLLSNAVMMCAAAVCGGLAVERLRSDSNTVSGSAIALLAGMAAATAACPFLEPVSALTVGLWAGAVAVIRATPKRTGGRRDRSLASVLAISQLTGGAFGIGTLALLESSRGFLYTGSPALIIAQLGVLLIAGGGSALVAYACSPVLGRVTMRA